MTMPAKKKILQYIGSLHIFILAIALCLGLYNQWQFSKDPAILVIAFLGLFIFGILCVLHYYFQALRPAYYGDYQALGTALLHISLGCILGIVIFTKKKEKEYVTSEIVMDTFLVISVVVKCLTNGVERHFQNRKPKPIMISNVVIQECIGMIAASFVTGNEALPIMLLIAAFELNLIAIRMKSFLGLSSLIVFVVLSALFFLNDLQLPVNVCGLICIVGSHAFEPIIDFYFSGFSTLERWQTFFNKPKILRHLTVVVILILNLGARGMISLQTVNYMNGFFNILLFIGFFLLSVIWFFFHILSFLICWRLMNKITDCNSTFSHFSDERKSMNRIMSSKGMRYFGIISQRLVCLTLISTVVLGAIAGWTTRTGYSLGLTLIIIPIECMTFTLIRKLGNCLGGTAIGYAIIAPVTQSRVSYDNEQIIGNTGASLFTKITKFFDFHMIDNNGCDFSTSGLAADHLESKVKTFFASRMTDGPRYDTYVLFYSGKVNDNGDWALADDMSLGLDTLLDWWSIENGDAGSRLILILDTTHSYVWAKKIQCIRDQYVAIQTCQYGRPNDLGSVNQYRVGAFAHDWVNYHLDDTTWTGWSIKAIYEVSEIWTDITFHIPTKEENTSLLKNNFPEITHPIFRIVNDRQTEDLCCECVTRFIRRIKMKWFPPKELDTGHGFKLVRS